MASLRELIAAGRPIAVPGATDALSAKLIEAHGFDCVYIGSYATAASRFGLPDTGLLSLGALVEQARTIVGAVKVPVIADAEGGFTPARRRPFAPSRIRRRASAPRCRRARAASS